MATLERAGALAGVPSRTSTRAACPCPHGHASSGPYGGSGVPGGGVAGRVRGHRLCARNYHTTQPHTHAATSPHAAVE
jgi:hypothetical protein